ncbi:xanthine dehydrogenase molybdopterin binding subunit [Aestuariivirga litoralis]|uniref:xanthine dehydrogenase molybdopterin binding subunit n=1 Tax=Aestuariivirga litoralis TaxID=2650924 RepID=UPI001FEEF45A|nr:xanthine dehydrogenase molybdopterin binding subunit [Aestuariivirga litoralis]
MARPLAQVGRSLKHDSADLHVQGLANYVDDIPEIEGTVHVAPGYAKDAAKGKITKLDLSAVRAAPGVLAVFTAEDIPHTNGCSPVGRDDDPVLARGEIAFHGQVIFAVVGETRDAARRATRLAVIEVAKEKPAVSVADAVAMGTQDISPPYAFNSKNLAGALKASAHRHKGKLTIGGQEQFYLEGQVSYVVPQEKGGMFVHCSTQHPTEVQHLVAHMLGIDDALVTCECRRMGGGFGGKESQAAQWACLAALTAYKLNRPAKCRLDRDDDMIMTGKRHDFEAEFEVGVGKDLRIKGVSVDLFGRCGYSADLSDAICDRAMFHSDNSYFYPEYHIGTRRLRTNTVSNTAYRGFGGPQGIIFADAMMEQLAISLGIDALELRKKNLYVRGRDVTPYGQKIEEHVLVNLVSELERTSQYAKRRKEITKFNKQSRWLKKGLALTPVKFGISFTFTQMNQAGALVHVYTDGSVHLNHGGTEMGQGLYQKVAQVVAEVFSIDVERVNITATRTDKVPNTSPTAASSGTDLNGMAAFNAANTIKARMTEFAAKLWKVKPAAVKFENSVVSAGKKAMSFTQLAQAVRAARISLSSTGFYATPKIHWDRPSGKGQPFFYFANGAACSEVLVDVLTGEMKVTKVDILQDVGRSLNPALDIGQIEGGFVQGMGWLTTEELVFDAEGRLRTHAPSTYKIPCASDVPEHFKVVLYQSKGNKEDSIYRSKAVGEPPLNLPVSVWCAVMNAVASLRPGVVPDLHAPATAEAIMKAVKSMGAAA